MEFPTLNVAYVPAGFIVSSECSKNSRLSPKIQDILSIAIVTLETQTNKEFGSIDVEQVPLLLSIRSSEYSTSSTENLKDTVLNLGMNDEIVKVLEETSQNPRWAYDTYRLFLQMFGTLVMGVDSSLYDDILSEERAIRGVQYNSNFFVADLQRIIATKCRPRTYITPIYIYVLKSHSKTLVSPNYSD